MALDPQAQAIVDMLAALNAPPIETVAPATMRVGMARNPAFAGPKPDIASVESRSIPGPAGDIPVRIYHPGADGPLPVLVWFHGGGWVAGDLDFAEGTCRDLANKAGVLVVSVDYRLAPEAPYPAAVEDCSAATAWVAEHASDLGGRADRLAVGGDSAGGNLAAVVSILAARRGGPDLAFQLLVYPATDALMSYPSVQENGEGYLLTKASMAWFTNHYLGADGDRKDPLVSPIYADASELAAVPPALVITAEYDPLRDEGEAYGLRLEQAGVAVKVSRYDGQIHGFFSMTSVVDAGGRAVDEAADGLRQALA